MNDQDVHENLMRGVRSARGLYGRARGKSAVEVAQDNKVWSRLKETAKAAAQVWSGVSEPPPKRKSRRSGRLAGLLLAGGAATLALNGSARAKAMGLIGGSGNGEAASTAEAASNSETVSGDVSPATEGSDDGR